MRRDARGECRREPVLVHEPHTCPRRKLGDGRSDHLQRRGFEHDVGQIGLRREPVVQESLFVAEHFGGSRDWIERPGLTRHDRARSHQRDLPRSLVPYRASDGSERVQVLHLAPVADHGAVDAPVRHVDVHSELAGFHVGVAHAQEPYYLLECLRGGGGFLGATQVRRGDDLDEGGSRAVQVHESPAARTRAFPGVHLQLQPFHPQRPGCLLSRVILPFRVIFSSSFFSIHEHLDLPAERDW